MILATKHGDRELRSAEWGTEHLIQWPQDGGVASPEGLPAVGAAIRLISNTIASLPLCVYSGEGETKRKREESWQYELLEFPNPDVSNFAFLSDIASGIEGCGNAFVYKARMPRQKRVLALATLQPQNVTVRTDFNTGETVYEYWNGRETIRLNPDDLIHIRGDTIGGGVLGYSPLTMHRMSLNNMSRREQFEGAHYENGALPGVALKFPERVKREQAKEWADDWDARHAGSANRGRTAVLGGGADIQTFPISLEDQQFVESQAFSVKEVARMFGVPATLLEEGDQQTSEEESLRFLKFCLLPRMNRIEEALLADPDLFGRHQDLYPEFFVDDFLRGDAVSMAQVDHNLVQSGILLVDEARARRGMPPLPPVPKDPDQEPGKVPQIVPVGGQANPGMPPPQE